jgi:hypothetical protein
MLLAVITPVAAQETMHQFLERLGPGQPKGFATAPVIME